MDNTKNVFISHHHKDDKSVSAFTDLLAGKDYNIRNSSIRVNEKNKERLEKKQIPKKTLERLLSMKMRWAGTVVVLIGTQTHSREWVNWEIDQAAKQGKRIIGVYINGASDSDIPESFEKYGNALVGWKSDRIIGAIDGSINNWETPTGEPREGHWSPYRSTC
ncbi:MAG: TIR domain-containing protein [Bacteroidetes bacterium]|nr:TIR domain-containing protein [Bacteroidota bacterium]